MLWRLSFRSYTKFFRKKLEFLGFLSVPHLVDNYAKIVDERGRNLMCNRKLPSLLVDFLLLEFESDFSHAVVVKGAKKQVGFWNLRTFSFSF